jgi:cytochrome c5
MQTKKQIMILAGALAAPGLGAVSMMSPSASGQPATRPASEPAFQSKSITLPTMDPVLPDGPGKTAYQATCTICHSARYVTMQPRFSRSAWTNEVQKMVANYGAPVPAAQTNEIVDYLVSIRGITESQVTVK